MVNATQMAKPFGKRCNDFLSSKQTKELINSLSAKTGISATDLVVVNQGGNNQGTWLHEDLALIFAQWLSPDFYLWCNDRIKELLKTGVTTVSNDDEAIAYAMEVLNKRLAKAKAEKEALEQRNNELCDEIKTNAPKVLFANAVIGIKTSCLIGELAKVLSQNGFTIGQNRLFKWLRDKHYLGTTGERYNIPNQQYVEQGLFEIKKGTRSGSEGVMHTVITTKVTGKGQAYFVDGFLSGRFNL